MRYLVTLETVDSGQTPPSPPEQAAYLETVVAPTMQMLKEWESAGKIRGGILTGRRGGAFIIDAASNEEAGDMIRQLPVWGGAEVEVTPLDSFDHTEKQITETVKTLKSM